MEMEHKNPEIAKRRTQVFIFIDLDIEETTSMFYVIIVIVLWGIMDIARIK
jgi:hypothetical protein